MKEILWHKHREARASAAEPKVTTAELQKKPSYKKKRRSLLHGAGTTQLVMRLRRRSVRTPRRAGVGAVVGLGLGARLGGVGRQPGGSEDVLAGPALGGCIHTIVCGTRDQVRKGRELGGNWMF